MKAKYRKENVTFSFKMRRYPAWFFAQLFTSFYICHSYSLVPNVPVFVDLSPGNRTTLSVTDIKQGTSYIVFQAHSQSKNVTLSLHPDITRETSETGRNVGVLIEVKGETNPSVYLTSEQNVTFKVLVFVILAENDLNVVPGGCNLEFNMENDPNFHITYNSAITNVKFQWARNSTDNTNCENSPTLYQLTYHLYVYYIGNSDWSEEAYFDGLQKMLTAADVESHGTKMQEIKYATSKVPLSKLPSYTGQGTIYNMVVKNGDRVAAYVPMATYSCDLDQKETECHSAGTAGKVMITVAGIVGVFLCFFGHRFFQTGILFMSFCGFCIIFYLVFNITTTQSFIVIFVLSCILATVAAVLWLMLWWYFGQPVLSILIPCLTAGYLFSSVLFYTPFGNIHYWTTRYNYGMAFTVGVLVLPVLILYWTKVLNILCCAFVGSFLTTVTVDLWIEAGIKFIIINSFRHAYINNYLDVIVTGPFQTKDIILTILWAVLLFCGAAFQFYREKGKPDFPPCPRAQRKMRQNREGSQVSGTGRHRQIGNVLNGNDERSPLLQPHHDHNYAALQAERSETA